MCDVGRVIGQTHQPTASKFLRFAGKAGHAKLTLDMSLSSTAKRITSATPSMSMTSTTTKSIKTASGEWRNT
jgi:hypothetical protein